MAATLTPKPFRLGYMPSLDGIRGVSILWVIGVHANLIGGSSAIIGVILFFVLSGFLITSLLLEEWNGYRDISLKNFYLRRALRLLPALLVMLAVFILYSYLVSPRKIFVNHARQVLPRGHPRHHLYRRDFLLLHRVALFEIETEIPKARSPTLSANIPLPTRIHWHRLMTESIRHQAEPH